MRVNIVLPFAGLTGGIRAVAEIANRLHDRGHTVCLIHPEASVCSRRNRLLRLVPGGRRLMRRNEGDLAWARPRCRVLRVPDLTPEHVPPADVVVATAWQTAEFVARYPASHGVGVYFIQHYEIWSGPGRLVDGTWRAGLYPVVTAPWLADLARDRFGLTDVDLVPYGVDTGLFRPDPGGRELRGGGFRVGLLCHPDPWKGTVDGLKALRALRERNVDARPVLFGTSELQRWWPDPGVEIEFHLDPPQERLRAIYSSLDAYLCPSHTETGPLTVLEAMACNVAVVTTEVGSVPIWSDGGRAVLYTPVQQPESAARALDRLYREPKLREKLGDLGRRQAEAFTWDTSAARFEEALHAALAGSLAGEP